jgi:hypothetical protein
MPITRSPAKNSWSMDGVQNGQDGSVTGSIWKWMTDDLELPAEPRVQALGAAPAGHRPPGEAHALAHGAAVLVRQSARGRGSPPPRGGRRLRADPRLVPRARDQLAPLGAVRRGAVSVNPVHRDVRQFMAEHLGQALPVAVSQV